MHICERKSNPLIRKWVQSLIFTSINSSENYQQDLQKPTLKCFVKRNIFWKRKKKTFSYMFVQHPSNQFPEIVYPKFSKKKTCMKLSWTQKFLSPIFRGVTTQVPFYSYCLRFWLWLWFFFLKRETFVSQGENVYFLWFI